MVVLYDYVMLFLSLREERRLRIFEYKRDENEELRGLHNEKFLSLYH